MEMLILAMVCAYVVKNGAVDVIHALKGQTSPRRQAARSRVPNGAATKFFSQLWHDSWDDALTRHNQRRAGQRPQPRPDKPRSAARVFWSGVGQDARRAARRRWDQGWVSLDEKRRERATRARPGQQTVPGQVVPDGDEPVTEPRLRSWLWRRAGWKCCVCGSTQGVQEVTFGRGLKTFHTGLRYCPKHLAEQGPGTGTGTGETAPEAPGPGDPEPVLRDQPGGGTDLQFGTDPTDPTGTRSCSGCGGALVVDGELCALCQYRQQQRNQYHDEQQSEYHDSDIAQAAEDLLRRLEDMNQDTPGQQANPTQEGTPTMTAMPTTEVVGLDQAISYCEYTAKAHREAIVAIERTQAALNLGDVSGPAAGYLAQAMEANTTAADAMDSAAAELSKQKSIQEQYDAVQGAGTREFITNGR